MRVSSYFPFIISFAPATLSAELLPRNNPFKKCRTKNNLYIVRIRVDNRPFENQLVEALSIEVISNHRYGNPSSRVSLIIILKKGVEV